jgi:hypothetical protein
LTRFAVEIGRKEKRCSGQRKVVIYSLFSEETKNFIDLGASAAKAIAEWLERECFKGGYSDLPLLGTKWN